MALSQFKTAVLGDAEVEGRGVGPAITVGGPLLLDPRGKYGPNVTVQFVIIQSDKDEHDPLKARRVRGSKDFPSDALLGDEGRWEATVRFDANELRPGPARGVGVAVVEHLDPFAYESYTWCDFIQLGGPSATAP